MIQGQKVQFFFSTDSITARQDITAEESGLAQNHFSVAPGAAGQSQTGK
jgi:hypothetical protein